MTDEIDRIRKIRAEILAQDEQRALGAMVMFSRGCTPLRLGRVWPRRPHNEREGV